MHRPLEPETDNADAGSLSTISALRYYVIFKENDKSCNVHNAVHR